jgi:hypothetical protein
LLIMPLFNPPIPTIDVVVDKATPQLQEEFC